VFWAGVRAVAGTQGEQRDHERVLHGRLLDGDPLATVDLFRHFSSLLVRRLAVRYQTTDPELIEEAVSQALLDYFTHPDRYDPSKRSLRGYLAMSAERDLQNLRQARQSRSRLLREENPGELDDQARRQWEAGGDVADEIAEDETAQALWEKAMAVARTDEERIVQRLRLEGERSTAVYAAALGWADLPFDEQQRRLYRVKDRLDQRFRRRGGGHHG
jgi:RNA polymerase sigma-70 factor, ECF subfamily